MKRFSLALSLIGVVMWGSLAGCMLPFLLRAPLWPLEEISR